jgi:hypothetical protein
MEVLADIYALRDRFVEFASTALAVAFLSLHIFGTFKSTT